jgi:hypothetical protein
MLLVLVHYSSRITTPANMDALRDLFDHSQWTLAVSKRGISDEQLYQVASEDLVKNRAFFRVAPEVPPFAKYLYGLALATLGRPYIVSAVLYVLSVVLIYLLSFTIFKDRRKTLLASVLFALEPVIFSQINQIMLDLPQLVALEIHALSTLYIVKSKGFVKRTFFILLGGLSLGMFIATKIGFLSVVIVAADLAYFFVFGKVWIIFVELFLAALFYGLTYLPYILSDSPIAFIKSQLWVIHFYFQSKVKPVYGAVIPSMLFGINKSWGGSAVWYAVKEWTLFWPVYFLAFTRNLVDTLKTRPKFSEITYIFILSSFFLVIYCLIPFWARYLVLLTPFLIIGFVSINLYKYKRIFFLILIVFLVQVCAFLYPPPTESVKLTTTLWEKSTYQDLYDLLTFPTAPPDKTTYWEQMLTFESNLKLLSKKVIFNLPNRIVWPWETKVSVKVHLSYITPIGVLENVENTYFVRVDREWKLVWRSEMALKNWLPDKSKIVNTWQSANYGRLKDASGTILAEDTLRPYFSVQPDKIKNEELLLEQLMTLTGLKKYNIEYFYKANNLPFVPAKIGFLADSKTVADLKNKPLDPGIIVTFTNHIFPKSEFAKTKKLQSIFYAINYNFKTLSPMPGGKITLYFGGRKQTLLKQKARPGQDVVVSF